MNRHRRARRSLLVGGMSTLAGVWVFGAESLAALLGAVTSSGCDPRVKYGGPPPELLLDASASPSAAPESTASSAADGPDADSATDGDTPEASAAASASATATAPLSGPPKYGGPTPPVTKYGGPPPRPKYGGPVPQPRKYGGSPPGDLSF